MVGMLLVVLSGGKQEDKHSSGYCKRKTSEYRIGADFVFCWRSNTFFWCWVVPEAMGWFGFWHGLRDSLFYQTKAVKDRYLYIARSM